jgi:hypothetical protein
VKLLRSEKIILCKRTFCLVWYIQQQNFPDYRMPYRLLFSAKKDREDKLPANEHIRDKTKKTCSLTFFDLQRNILEFIAHHPLVFIDFQVFFFFGSGGLLFTNNVVRVLAEEHVISPLSIDSKIINGDYHGI